MGLLVSFIVGVGTGLFAASLKTVRQSDGEGGTLLKNGIKGAILASDRVRELVAQVKEAAQDAAAEARAELGRAQGGSGSNGEADRTEQRAP